MAKKRRHKSRGDLESQALRGRWADLKHNDTLHTPAENQVARRRCRQLIDGGPAAVSWSELLGER